MDLFTAFKFWFIIHGKLNLMIFCWRNFVFWKSQFLFFLLGVNSFVARKISIRNPLCLQKSVLQTLGGMWYIPCFIVCFIIFFRTDGGCWQNVCLFIFNLIRVGWVLVDYLHLIWSGLAGYWLIIYINSDQGWLGTGWLLTSNLIRVGWVLVDYY